MVYLAFDIMPEQLSTAVRGMQALGFAGFNVTIPYKEAVIDILDSIDPEAEAIGAVNTVKIQNGRLHGYNTDGSGLIESLRRNNIEVRHKKVLILGAGGSARSAGIYLAKECPASIRIWNRTPDRAAALSDAINKYKGSIAAVPVADIPADADVIINTTPLGMWPKVDGNPLLGVKLRKGTVVYDIVYNPARTAMLQYAEEQGCITAGGIGMLAGQALLAVEIWTESKLPDDSFDIMLRAVSKE